MALSTAYIKSQISTWITDDVIAEFEEVWNENIEDREDEQEFAEINFAAYVRKGRHWSRIHKARFDGDIIRTYELGPSHTFGGIFKLEITSDASDENVKKYYFYNE